MMNSMHLDDHMADDLIAAGLHFIAFSLDAADEELTDSLRSGTNLVSRQG
ncbi:MAG: radical SAM protein [Proteobacteria bacterium]|nr:radical SAM protein [Pseudomonadota bacterium]MBU1739023.1 radical SAM protein [Pseudomonadota bacterium]